jgi:molybdopterin-guanine dinucleotide biosynthesis protein A
VTTSSAPSAAPRLDAVVLVGGTGRRLGGVDKASLVLDGRSLLELALAATAAAARTVLVGDPTETSRPVLWTRESPTGGGPAAGLLAGLDALASTLAPDFVCVLAVDMPRVTAQTVGRLYSRLTEEPGADAAVLVDVAGVRQTLAGVYRYSRLVAARPASAADEQGLSIRRLVAGLRFLDVPSVGDEARDVDTWDDLSELGG